MAADGFGAVFDALRTLLAAHADSLVVVHDDAEQYYLDTAHRMPNGKPLFFGAVRIGKRYVSFHLMPVYVNPALLEQASPDLRRRMQGKSCFNFAAVDETLFAELAALAARGFADYRERGYV